MNMNAIPLTSLLNGSFGQLSQQDLQTLMQSIMASAAAQEGRKDDEGDSGEAPGTVDAKNLAAALGQGMLAAALPGNPAEWMMSSLMAGQVPAPTGTVDSLGDEPSETAGQSQGGGKARRAAWSAEEEARLVELANRYQAAGQRMCWRIIAQELGTGRTSKQCREHYLNSLRPNMKKGQWTQKEEYVIAREHSRIGSHWCMIAKKLPGRTDNSIKNFYNATVRSKAVNKIDSFLWLYVTRVKTGMPPKDAFDEAQAVWTAHASPAVVQEVMAAEDGAEALMLLAEPKSKGLGASGLLAAAGLQGLQNVDAHTIESLLAQVQSNQNLLQSQPLAQAQLQELLSGGAKRERPDGGDMTALLTGAADGSDAKRAKLLQDMAGGANLHNLPGNAQALSRQDFLQQLGLAYTNDPQQQSQQQAVVAQQPQQQQQQPLTDMNVLQQQLQLQALLQAAAQSGQALPTLSQITGQQGGAVPMNLSLLNQLAGGQGVVLGSTQQQGHAATNAAGQLVSNGAGGTMMSLLGVDGGANAGNANGDGQGNHDAGAAEALQQQMGHSQHVQQQQQQQRQAEQAAQQVVLANAHHQVVLQQQQQQHQQQQHVGHYQLVSGYDGVQAGDQARLVKTEDGTMVSLDPSMLAQLGDLAGLPASALGLQTLQPVSVVQLSAADAAAMQAASMQQHNQ